MRRIVLGPRGVRMRMCASKGGGGGGCKGDIWEDFRHEIETEGNLDIPT